MHNYHPIQEVIDFNEKAGFLGKGMDTFAEAAYILEEGIEGFEPAFNGQHEDGTPVVPGDPEWITARQWSLSLMNQILQAFEQRNLPLPSPVAEVDKSIDGMTFHVGKLAKMGLSRDQIIECWTIVNARNFAKLGGPIDEHGKQLKPEGWYGPEPELQEVLDRIKD